MDGEHGRVVGEAAAGEGGHGWTRPSARRISAGWCPPQQIRRLTPARRVYLASAVTFAACGPLPETSPTTIDQASRTDGNTS